MKRRAPAVTRAFVVPGVLFAVGFTGPFFYLRDGIPDDTSSALPIAERIRNLPDSQASSSPKVYSSQIAEGAEQPELEHYPEPSQPAPEPQPSQSSETLQALAITATSDGDPTTRRSAIAALTDLARSGHEVNAVRDTLRLAAADEDATVAERAKEAYDELIRTEDSLSQNLDSDSTLD
jgi:hypothetical protein